MEHESNGYTNYNWHARYSYQRISTGTGGLENKKTSRDHLNYSIVDIDQNSKKSSRELRRLAIIQPLVENYQFTLV